MGKSTFGFENVKMEETNVPEENGESNPKPLKIEEVYEQLGGFSKFQIFASMIILMLEMPAAMVVLSPILTSTNHVDFYCDTVDSSTLLSKEELCNYTCAGNITSKRPFNSIVQEWNLICDRAWVSDTLTSLFMFGGTLGPLITAQIADRYGRKPAFFLICALFTASGIFSSLAGNIYIYGVSKFLSGMIAAGTLVAHMNYLMEFLTPSWRVICGCVSMWPIGEMLLGLTGYLFPAWRALSWISVIPAFLILLTFPFLPESPRWLLCKNKTKEAEKVLKTIAHWNSKPPLDPETVRILQTSVLEEESDDSQVDLKPSPWSTFKDSQLLKKIFIFAFAWFANALTYFGISFNMKNMSGNPYINVFLMGLLDYPAELSGIYFSNKFGRRITFISFLALSVLSTAAVAGVELSIPNADVDYGTLILVFCLIGRYCNESSWAVMACFTGESFPTIVRSISFSICTVCGSIAGIMAPQMVYLGSFWAPGPYIVFCGFSCISCMLSFLLPETNERPLRDVRN